MFLLQIRTFIDQFTALQPWYYADLRVFSLLGIYVWYICIFDAVSFLMIHVAFVGSTVRDCGGVAKKRWAIGKHRESCAFEVYWFSFTELP